MLTSNLVRTKTRKGQVFPEYLDVTSPDAMNRAEALLRIFREAKGSPKGEIDAAVEDVVGFGTDFLLWRGLAKLLYDRSTFEVDAIVDPVEIRRTVFELAALAGGVYDDKGRAEVFEGAAERLGVDAEACSRSLYADLEERQILTAFKDLRAGELLDRYNLALAQAVLYGATRLTITLDDVDSNRLRYLFGALKFHGLMHTVRRSDEGYEIVLDGPSSLFSKSRKYGLQMAKFLPALLKVESFRLIAELSAKNKAQVCFELTEAQGLRSHYTMRGQWISQEEKWFEERFAKLDTNWTLERRGTIIELDANEVLVADYVLTSPEGVEVHVEIVGFWRLAYLERRIDNLTACEHPPLVLVVAERLKTGREKLTMAPPEVVFFKGVILADKVLDAAKRLIEAIDG